MSFQKCFRQIWKKSVIFIRILNYALDLLFAVFQVDPSFLTLYEIVHEAGGLQTSTLGINFKLGNNHFREGVLKLKCVATIGKRNWQEERVIGHKNIYETRMASATRSSKGNLHYYLFRFKNGLRF